MKISLSLYIFTHTKYIYLKRRKKFLSKYGPRKTKNKRFLRKKPFYGSGSFNCENYIMRFLTFCILKASIQFLKTYVFVFYCKKRLIFTCYNVKTHPLPFKSVIFSEIFVSKTNAETFFRRKSVE